MSAAPKTMANGLDAGLDELLRLKSVEQFLFHEADLLDRRAFDIWIDLLADEFWYVVPTIATGIDMPEANEDLWMRHHNSYFEEGKEMVLRRISRLGMPTAWSENPPSRTCRSISNIRVEKMDGDRLSVTSKFVLHKSRFDFDSATFHGTRRDILRADAGTEWKILERRVELIETAIDYHNLSLFF